VVFTGVVVITGAVVFTGAEEEEEEEEEEGLKRNDSSLFVTGIDSLIF